MKEIKQFSAMNIKTIGEIQSFYALRYFEIACSWYNSKGRYGNKKDQWKFKLTVDEIKTMFKIDKDAYKDRMNNFITKVVKNPIEELNDVNKDFQISYVKIVENHKTVGFEFTCEQMELLKIEKTDSVEEKQDKSDDKNVCEVIDGVSDEEEYDDLFEDEYEIKFSTVELDHMIDLNEKLDEYKRNELFNQKDINDINEIIKWQLQFSKRSDVELFESVALCNKVEFLRRFKKYDGCNKELQENIRKSPHNGYFWLEYAYLFLYLNKNLKAFECYTIASLFTHIVFEDFSEKLEDVYNHIDFDEVRKTRLVDDNLELNMERIKLIEINDSSEYSLLNLVILTEESIKEIDEINKKIANNMEDAINRELFEEVWQIEESAHFWEDEGIYLSSTEVNFEKVYSQIDRKKFLDGLNNSDLNKLLILDRKFYKKDVLLSINEDYYRKILKTLDIEIPTWSY